MKGAIEIYYFTLFCVFLSKWSGDRKSRVPLTAFVLGRKFVCAIAACRVWLGTVRVMGWQATPGHCHPSLSQPRLSTHGDTPSGHPLCSLWVGNFFPALAHPEKRPLASSLFYWCLLITSLLWRDTNCSLHTMLVIMPITFWFISICQHYYKGDGGAGGEQSFIIGYCLQKKPAQSMSEVFFVEIENKIINKSLPLTSRKWTL